jgi:hypothetical protein
LANSEVIAKKITNLYVNIQFQIKFMIELLLRIKNGDYRSVMKYIYLIFNLTIKTYLLKSSWHYDLTLMFKESFCELGNVD